MYLVVRIQINENNPSLTAIDITKEKVTTLVRNSFLAGFIDETQRKKILKKLDEYCILHHTEHY